MCWFAYLRDSVVVYGLGLGFVWDLFAGWLDCFDLCLMFDLLKF